MATLTLSLIAAWLSQAVLPDNARQLWRRADIIRRAADANSEQGKPRRSYAEIDQEFRATFRDLAKHMIPLTKQTNSSLDTYIQMNKDSPDPATQEFVKQFRKIKAKNEAELRWYQRILDTPESGLLPTPK